MKKPLALSDCLSSLFDVTQMSDGYKRGMILSVAPVQIGGILRNKKWMDLCSGFKFNGTTFIIFVTNSIFASELNMHKEKIKRTLNTRVASEIIQDVRVIIQTKKR